MRVNDGGVDAEGRFWFGSMGRWVASYVIIEWSVFSTLRVPSSVSTPTGLSP